MRRSRREDVAFSAHTDLSAYSNDELESQLDARSEALRQIELSCSGKAGTAGAGETGAPVDESGLGKTITALLPLCRVEFVCGLDRQALKAAWCNESCAAAPDEKPASCPSCDEDGGEAPTQGFTAVHGSDGSMWHCLRCARVCGAAPPPAPRLSIVGLEAAPPKGPRGPEVVAEPAGHVALLRLARTTLEAATKLAEMAAARSALEDQRASKRTLATRVVDRLAPLLEMLNGGDRATGGGGAARCGGAAQRALTWAPPGGGGGAGRLAPGIALPGLTAGCGVDVGCVHMAVAVDGLDGIHTSGAVASSSVSRPGAWSARRARSTVAGSQMLVSIPALRHARRSAEMGTGSAIGRFVRLAALSRRARSK